MFGTSWTRCWVLTRSICMERVTTDIHGQAHSVEEGPFMFLHQVPENQATLHEKYGTEEPQRLHDIKYVGGRDVIGILCTKWCTNIYD